MNEPADRLETPYRFLWNQTLVPLLKGSFPRSTSYLSHPKVVEARIRHLTAQGDVESACVIASLVHLLCLTENRCEFMINDAQRILTGHPLPPVSPAQSGCTPAPSRQDPMGEST